MIQSYSDPSEAFPRLPDLTAVKARWRIRCNRWIRSLQPVSSVLLLVATLRPDPTSAAFPPAAFSSSVSQSLQPGRPSAPPDAILHLHNRAKGSLSFFSSDPHRRSFQNNRMYYLIRVPEKVFFAFIFFHLVLIVSFFVYVLNYYASTNPAAFGMLKNWELTKETKMKPTTTAMLNLEEDDTSQGKQQQQLETCYPKREEESLSKRPKKKVSYLLRNFHLPRFRHLDSV